MPKAEKDAPCRVHRGEWGDRYCTTHRARWSCLCAGTDACSGCDAHGVTPSAPVDLSDLIYTEVAMFAHSRGSWKPRELADHLATYLAPYMCLVDEHRAAGADT